ncbi:hypothetical protein GCM10009679_32710 [Saccharothrix algeriensis]|uniref:Uncharacterized protein n=1 Tax=Catellatospora bangladeshensis TaxID=310355 RepID=A0A8J3JPB0_9ACTN|nr:hypothetical protein Cba03nite_21930 [Catellatospora bangladeshensis]
MPLSLTTVDNGQRKPPDDPIDSDVAIVPVRAKAYSLTGEPVRELHLFDGDRFFTHNA